jgi:molybdopterin/thiamine biosynthesis adenylyltransferase
MMNYVLRMRANHHRRLAALLQAAMPAESVAFLTCRRVQAQDAVIFLVDEIVSVDHIDYGAQAEDIASITPQAMASIAQKARQANRVVVMAHLHPMTERGVEFSQADHRGNQRSFAFFHRRVPQAEHIALVWNASVNECVGLVYPKQGAAVPLNSVVVVDDDRWREFIMNRSPIKPHFARQALLLGSHGQGQLSAVSCAVIGLGGTGSLASLALVHHGVRQLTLVDDELLDDTNLPRIPFSVPGDARRRHKVHIARDYVRAHAPDARVNALLQHVEHPEVLAHLIGCDLIVVCTDNTTSRAYLNQLCQQYMIPLLDLGVQFSVKSDGTIGNEVGRINLVRPGTPCLWCSAHINPDRLAAESVPKVERESKDSYLRGFDDPQPSMLAFNMEVVGRGMQVLVGYLTGLFGQPCQSYEQRSFLKSKGGAMSRQISKAHRLSCPICSTCGHGADLSMSIRRRAA